MAEDREDGYGECPHGKFKLSDGCPLCTAEARQARIAAQDAKPHLVKVRYLSESTGELSQLAFKDQVIVDELDNKLPEDPQLPESICDDGSVCVGPDVVDKFVALGGGRTNEHPVKVNYTQESPPCQPFASSPGTVFEHEEFKDRPNTGSAPMGMEPVKTVPWSAVVVEVEVGKDAKVMEMGEKVMGLATASQRIAIKEKTDIEAAANDLKIIKDLRKQIDDLRKELLVPARAATEKINSVFKSMLLEPLDAADSTLQNKIKAWRQAEALRIEAAERARKALAEAEAKEAEARGEAPPPVVEEEPEKQQGVYRGELGTLGTRKNWKWAVEDEDKIPRRFLVVDGAAVLKAVQKGESIPGIKAWQEESLVRG